MHKILQLLRDNEKRERCPANLVTNGEDAEIYIYDVISSDWGVSALSIVEQVKQAASAQTLTIHINSPGGDVFEGRAIMAAIQSFQGKTVAKIDSLCASAATSIALACDEVEMADGAFFMIHCAMGLAYGDKQDLRDRADLLEKVEGAIVNDYVEKTGKPPEEIISMMEEETWLTASEALDNGFVDRISDNAKAKNTWNLAAFDKAPKELLEPPENKTDDNEPAPAGFFMSVANENSLRLAEIS